MRPMPDRADPAFDSSPGCRPTMPDQPPNIAAVLDEHAVGRPDHPALVFGERTWTHAAFARRVRRAAAVLAEEGIGQGDLVGIALPDSDAAVVLMFALARLGAILLPMDDRWSAAEKDALADWFRPARILAPGSESVRTAPVLAVDAAFAARIDAAPDRAPIARAPDLPLLVSLSSGTTGRPRGPAVTHAQMIHRFVNQTVSLTFDWYDRFVTATPLYFGGGRTFTLAFLYLGGTVILYPPPYQPADLAACLARHRATALFLVPTLMRRMLQLPESDRAPFRDLRLLVSSGAPLFPPERAAVRRDLNPVYFEYYASTEGGGITVLPPQDQEAHPESVGRPAFRVAVEIVDEAHRPLPPGEVGRVRYRGPGVAEAFFREPEADDGAFRDGWFYPGDLGVMDAAGYLTLRGRSKDMILRGGVNIYPMEIEQTLTHCADLADVAVFALPSPEFGEEVAAAVVPRGPGLDPRALDALCRDRLAPYKRPRRYYLLDALPRNSSGKTLKTALPDLVAERAPDFEVGGE